MEKGYTVKAGSSGMVKHHPAPGGADSPSDGQRLMPAALPGIVRVRNDVDDQGTLSWEGAFRIDSRSRSLLRGLLSELKGIEMNKDDEPSAQQHKQAPARQAQQPAPAPESCCWGC